MNMVNTTEKLSNSDEDAHYTSTHACCHKASKYNINCVNRKIVASVWELYPYGSWLINLPSVEKYIDTDEIHRYCRIINCSVLEYCSAVWCSAADTHIKLLDCVVSGAYFLTGGVFECDIAHHRSVAATVLCMLHKIRCNQISPEAPSLWCSTCNMCSIWQCRLYMVLWSHIGILMRLLAAQPLSTAGPSFPSQYACGPLWNFLFSIKRHIWYISVANVWSVTQWWLYEFIHFPMNLNGISNERKLNQIKFHKQVGILHLGWLTMVTISLRCCFAVVIFSYSHRVNLLALQTLRLAYSIPPWVLGRCLHRIKVPSLWYYTTHVANCLSY